MPANPRTRTDGKASRAIGQPNFGWPIAERFTAMELARKWMPDPIRRLLIDQILTDGF